MNICDAQVHAPPVPGHTGVNGIERARLTEEMATAGVDRAVIVPVSNPASDDENAPSLAIAQAEPDRFVVMGLLRLAAGVTLDDAALRSHMAHDGMVGLRVSCYRDPNRTLLLRDDLDWLWSAAERLSFPVMILAPGNLDKVARLAEAHPGLRVIIDHLGLDPFAVFSTAGALSQAAAPLLELARFENVAVKASGMPNTVKEQWPFPSTHDALRRVIGEFGAERVFWGSDMTRLTCTYRECVTHFTEGLTFLSSAELELIMGDAIGRWLAWP